MDAFVKILFSVTLCAVASNAGPIKRYDQRQDGDLNIQAHLDKIVLLIIPSKNINILDIKGQGQFDNYEDILPLFGGKDSSLNELKFKSALDFEKEKKTVVEVPILKDEKKEDKKQAEKPETKDLPKPSDVKKPTEVLVPKKVENENKSVASDTQKRITPKSDGRTYQTVQSGNNRERVIAVSQEELKKEDVPSNPTKVEKL